jgi:hypothetical protein
MTSVEVRCRELILDADKWKEASDALATAAQTAANLAMNEGQFGQWAERRGVISAYLALQQKFTKLATGASTEFTSISETLTKIAQNYLMQDQRGAQEMDHIKEHP